MQGPDLPRAAERAGAPLLLFAVLACFSLGMPRNMIRAVSTTMYLSQYPASSLAYIYLAVAAAIPLTTAIFLRVERRVSPRTLFFGLELVRLVAVALLWLGFATNVSSYLPIVAVVWMDVDFVLGSFMFWGLAGFCFRITETKRAYPLISAGEQVGGLLIGLATPLLLLVVQPIDLYWLSAVSITIGIALIWRIARRFPDLHERQRDEQRSAAVERPPPFNRQMRTYLVLILGAAFFSNAAYVVLDNLFYFNASKNFTDETALTSFLGLAFGLAGGATLLFSLFLAPRILARFGIASALSWLPALATALALCVIPASSSLVGLGIVPFVIITAMKLSDDGLRASLYRPSAQTLYQPIPPVQRMRVLAAVEGLAEPLGIAFGAGALLLIAYVFGFETFQVALLFLFVGVGWLVVTALLRRGYVTALSLAVSRRQNIETGLEALTGAEAKRLVLEKLGSKQIADRLAAAAMLRTLDPAIYQNMVPDLLRTGEAALVQQMLPHLADLKIDGLGDILKQRLGAEPDSSLGGQLALALARAGDPEGTTLLAAQAAVAGPAQEAALAALIGSDFGLASVAATRLVRELAAAPDPVERRRFLSATARSGSGAFYPEIMKLFDDPDALTRRAAFDAAGRLKHEAFIPLLADRLSRGSETREDCIAIARALAAIGKQSIGALSDALDPRIYPHSRVAAATGLGLIAWPAARGALIRTLADSSPDVSYAAAMGLWSAQVRLDAGQSKVAFAAVETLLHRAADAFVAEADVASLPGSDLLRSALQHRVALLTTQCFVLAALTHGIDSLKSVHFDSANLGADEKAVAVELVDSLLPASLRALAVAVVADLSLEQRIARLGKVTALSRVAPDERLRTLVLGNENTTEWIRAVSLSLAASARSGNLGELIAATQDETGLVGETARRISDVDRAQQGDAVMGLSTMEKVLFLRSVNLFKAIPDETLAEFAPVMLSEQYGPGEVIVTEGEFGASMYIIVSGEVEIVLGGRPVGRLGERAVVGELAALDPEKRTATIKAVSETHLMVLTNQHLTSLMAAHPPIADGIIRELCARLRSEFAEKRLRLGAQ